MNFHDSDRNECTEQFLIYATGYVKMVTIFPLMVKTSEIEDQAVQKCRGGLEKLLVTHFYDIQWFEKSK